MATATIKVEGRKVLTEMDRTIYWETGEKVDHTYVITDADGDIDIWTTLSLGLVANPRFIVFNGTGEYYVKIVGFARDEYNFELQDFFLLSPTPDFLSLIDTVHISTDSTEPVTVEVRLYGEAS